MSIIKDHIARFSDDIDDDIAKKFIRLDHAILRIDSNIDDIKVGITHGKILSAVGNIVIAQNDDLKIGDLCEIYDAKVDFKIDAEVVAIDQVGMKLLPFGIIHNISKQAVVRKKNKSYAIKVGEYLLGQVLDGFGSIINDKLEVDYADYQMKSINNKAPDPLSRPIIDTQLLTGVSAIDNFIPIGNGQRIAIFAGPGMGKTTLMGMILRNTSADVIVVGLIGERGREVREFIDLEVTAEIRKKIVLVVATSDKSPVEQVKSAYVAQTICEYFRDQGKNVILFIDSITRFARAQREVGLSSGEPITRGGFPPSVFLSFPYLMERAGTNQYGSITAFYTVLMEGDSTHKDPIADEVKSIIDGHILLSRKLAEQSHYPAIDILNSLSRIDTRIISEEHKIAAQKIRLLLSKYNELEFLIRVGEYKEGNDKLADEAIKKKDRIYKFLTQGVHQKVDFSAELRKLLDLSR